MASPHRFIRYLKPRRFVGQMFDPKDGDFRTVDGWIIGKVLSSKEAWESPVYREVFAGADGKQVVLG